jgi:signal transduction histidine kinase
VPFRRIHDPERLQALIGAMLLIDAGVELPDVLRTIVTTATDLVDARFGAVGVLARGRDELAEFVTVGVGEDVTADIGASPVGRGLLGTVWRDGEVVRIADVRDHDARLGFPAGHPEMHAFLGVPVVVAGEVQGGLYLCDKRGAPEFSAEDEDLVAALALAAGLAIDKAGLHGRLRALTLSEERERIARDLHDTVIQRLFGVGLDLQSLARLVDRPEAAGRLAVSVEDLDETIRHIRATVFAISRPLRLGAEGVQAEVLRVLGEGCEPFGLEVRVDFDGPIETAVGPQAAEHLLFSLREAVTNVARHAGADKVEIDVSVGDAGLTLRVADNGEGLGGARALSGRGLAGLEERAKLLGGSCVVRDRFPERGTELVWSIVRLR